jgi:hypothetical protein
MRLSIFNREGVRTMKAIAAELLRVARSLIASKKVGDFQIISVRYDAYSFLEALRLALDAKADSPYKHGDRFLLNVTVQSTGGLMFASIEVFEEGSFDGKMYMIVGVHGHGKKTLLVDPMRSVDDVAKDVMDIVNEKAGRDS